MWGTPLPGLCLAFLGFLVGGVHIGSRANHEGLVEV